MSTLPRSPDSIRSEARDSRGPREGEEGVAATKDRSYVGFAADTASDGTLESIDGAAAFMRRFLLMVGARRAQHRQAACQGLPITFDPDRTRVECLRRC